MMMLVLEIEYLSGVSFAALGPDAEGPEWPPQPDRVFSALTAAWATRGEVPEEAEALGWLEQQEPPVITASGHEPRTAPVAFVPPNDPRSDRGISGRHLLPEMRRRQPRRFQAARPHEPIVRMWWQAADADGGTLIALSAIARDVAYLGHSASLTRCQFMLLPEAPEGVEPIRPRRRVYPGRLSELRRQFASGHRPQPGAPARPVVAPRQETPNAFGDRWVILEHVGGVMPDIRASGLVARTIRDTILSGYERADLGDEIPEVVSGHASDGAVSRSPHLAIIPLPFVGFARADGHVMGFAVVSPYGSEILDAPDMRSALRAVAPMDEELGRRVMTVQTRQGAPRGAAFSIRLSPSFVPPANRRSLDPLLYTRPSREFATVTPVVLDRHLKARGKDREEEIRELLVRACTNSGLPEPEGVVAAKHAALEGVPSAYPSGGAPDWTRWRVPEQWASRQLTHAVLRFPGDIAGPVLLGAARHVGLGLCRPLKG